MRALHCLFIGILIVVKFSGAQDTLAVNRSVVFGVKAGFLVSGFWGNGIRRFEDHLIETVDDLTSRSIFFGTGGLFCSWGIIPDFISVQPELVYLRTGKNWEFSTEQGRVTAKVHNDYLALPLLFKMLIPLEGKVLPYAYLGPQIMVRINTATDNFSALPSNSDAFESSNISKNANLFDFGICTGFGIDFLTRSKNRWLLDLRYTFGTINLFDTEGFRDIRNSVFSFSTGFGWGSIQ
ncbi:MAG: PorT family protein [Fibrobacter sp.]|nr:PorT family protein [Fibrobacter sp.]